MLSGVALSIIITVFVLVLVFLFTVEGVSDNAKSVGFVVAIILAIVVLYKVLRG